MKRFTPRAYGLAVLALIATMAFTSCSMEDNPAPDPEMTEGYEKLLEKWDDLRFFQESIISLDEDGNILQRHYGAMLNPKDTCELYIGVNSLEEAEKEFRMFMSPDVTFQSDDPSTANLTVQLFSETYESQGFVYFTEGGDDCIAEVTVSPGTQIKHFNKIIFISTDSWPIETNGGNWKLGDVVVLTYRMSVREADRRWDVELTRDYPSVCIHEAGPGRQARFMCIHETKLTEAELMYGKEGFNYIGDEYYKAHNLNTSLIPTKEMAAQVLRDLSQNYYELKASFNKANLMNKEQIATLIDKGDEESEYWTTTRKSFGLIYWRWVVKLHPFHSEFIRYTTTRYGPMSRRLWFICYN